MNQINRYASCQARRFYQYDQQGSVAHTTDASGAMVDSRMYDAYGQEAARLPSGASFAPTDGYGFDARWGYVADRENGASASGMPLYYCQARNYAPNLARWLERDPIGFSGGMNQYAYCGGQPVGNADPSGLCQSGYPSFEGSDKDYCQQLWHEMNKLMDEIIFRWQDMYTDRNGLFSKPMKGSGSWIGHQRRYKSRQEELRKKVKDYTDFCGGPPGPMVRDAVTKPAPSRPHNGKYWDPMNFESDLPWWRRPTPGWLMPVFKLPRIIPLPLPLPVPVTG